MFSELEKVTVKPKRWQGNPGPDAMLEILLPALTWLGISSWSPLSNRYTLQMWKAVNLPCRKKMPPALTEKGDLKKKAATTRLRSRKLDELSKDPPPEIGGKARTGLSTASPELLRRRCWGCGAGASGGLASSACWPRLYLWMDLTELRHEPAV